MWYLISTNDKRVIYVLPDNNITIGRSVDAQCCNFAIPEDPSISRKHATLSVTDSQLYLQDLGSKYGTFVNENNEKIEHNLKIKMNSSDIIKFGKMGSVWKVMNINFTTCTSTLKGDSLQNLRVAMTKLGGMIKNDWDGTCEYLTMPAITLTIKVVMALVQCSHIVNVDYWNRCVEAVNTQTALPDPKSFVPQILESTLNKENVSFLPLMDRSTLFAGKNIIFFSRRQFDMYKVALLKSSGKPQLLSDTKMTKSMLCNTDVIVIQYNSTSAGQETQAHKDQINEIIDYIKSKGKRIIADAEIGLAILYCSVEKYCNPDFKFTTEVIKQAAGTVKESNVLAQESQENAQTLKKENFKIDESLTQSNDLNTTSGKRKLSDDIDPSISNANKKMALDESCSLNTNKRALDDSGEAAPSKRVALNNDDNEEMFDFIETSGTSKTDKDVGNKKLNLFKPVKRKLDERDTEEDLFNFVEDKEQNKTVGSKENTLDLPKKLRLDDSTVEKSESSNTVINSQVDLAALRGSKLNDLMKMNENLKTLKDIKKEDTSEIDEKFKNIDLGSTIIVVKNDLIIKREPLSVTITDNGKKNFKKFKKVWPVKFQVTLSS